MDSYCQTPPIVSQAIQPNILLAMDVSGSMGWCAYYTGSDSSHCDPNCSTGPGGSCGYNAAVAYEGYFRPDKSYRPDANGVYEETVATGTPCTITCTRTQCVRRSSQCPNAGQYGSGPGAFGCTSGRNTYGCCTDIAITGDCGVQSGNFLNYAHMHRIDLLRWAMTGGTPCSCVNGSETCAGNSFNNTALDSNSCDPELWNQSGNSGKVGSVCNDSLDINGDGQPEGGCILRANDGTQVKVPWDRVNGGLAFTFSTLTPTPRMAEMAFGGSQVIDAIYMGDFTSPNSTNDAFPYMNLITHVNSISPSGSTPTGPAMWDVLNYYSQKDPQFSQSGKGLYPESGSGDHWKNPMYICTQGGANCVFVPCAGNYVILMSDGQWNNPSCTIGSSPTCSPSSAAAASADPAVPAYCMHKGFTNAKSGTPSVSTKVNGVYTIGLFLGGTGDLALKNVAMYGSFDNASKLWPDGLSNFPVSSCGPVTDCCTSSNCGTGSSCTPLPASSSDWDKDGNNIPDTYYSASNALGIKDTILKAVLDILRHATSGTAVSILASGEGSGANLLQAFFYPKKAFTDSELDWIGEMQNLWYYLDPQLSRSTIREDTVTDRKLELKDDYVVHFRFDSTQNKTVADRYADSYDANNNWVSSNLVDTIALEETKNLWEAGSKLWLTTADERTLFTTTSSAYPFARLDLTSSNAAVLKGYLQAASDAEATNIINYIRGTDGKYCTISAAACSSDANCTGGAGDTCTSYRARTVTIPTYDATARVWKLGDIISSTPRLQSWIRLNTYNLDAPTGYGDDSYQKYLDSLNYATRGMVYAGANDGMLHAFKLGTLAMINNPSDELLIAQLCEDTNGNGKCDSGETTTTNLGKEVWSYIPKNALPYLRYLTDPDYCHLYYVDGTPYLFDASINAPSDCTTTGDYSTCPRKTTYITNTKNLDVNKTSWRTIVIGGMGQGGACRIGSSTCTDCVKTPTNDPANNTKGLGYSSYFALDITDPQNPSLLWEFSDPGLGFSISGPAVVRVGDRDQNGKWYVVFASGPTGPIDAGSRQFLAKSDQNLKLFILDLKTGALVRTIDTGIQNAFGGALMNATVDTDRWRPDRTGNYQDDVLYVGYSQQSGTSWSGGVLRVTTNESANVGGWVTSPVISGIGPVTAGVSHIQDRTNHRLWLYFGTGRYFYKIGTTIDDADAQRALYGIKEPCYLKDADRFDNTCSTAVASLTDATVSPPTSEPSNDGWFITLDASGTSYKAERVITNPLAAFTSAIFFTTFAPTADICGFSGNSYVWAVNYTTGGKPVSSALKGTALIQVSTGEIKEVPLASAFTEKGQRRTPGFQGVPPKGQGLSAVINPRPMKRVIHMRER
jgi:type IV pilus assembly protein PilY1